LNVKELATRNNTARATTARFRRSIAFDGYRGLLGAARGAVDEPAAEVVRRIFELDLDGWGRRAIAELQNREGVAHPMAHAPQQNRHRKMGAGSTRQWRPSSRIRGTRVRRSLAEGRGAPEPLDRETVRSVHRDETVTALVKPDDSVDGRIARLVGALDARSGRPTTTRSRSSSWRSSRGPIVWVATRRFRLMKLSPEGPRGALRPACRAAVPWIDRPR
jgi:hypothetical protein